MNDLHFRIWVANTVHDVSGMWPYEWRGMERKRPLTYSDNPDSACQVGSPRFSSGRSHGNLRLVSDVSTRKHSADGKPP
jgi:hypothetical protein